MGTGALIERVFTYLCHVVSVILVLIICGAACPACARKELQQNTNIIWLRPDHIIPRLWYCRLKRRALQGSALEQCSEPPIGGGREAETRLGGISPLVLRIKKRNVVVAVVVVVAWRNTAS